MHDDPVTHLCTKYRIELRARARELGKRPWSFELQTVSGSISSETRKREVKFGLPTKKRKKKTRKKCANRVYRVSFSQLFPFALHVFFFLSLCTSLSDVQLLLVLLLERDRSRRFKTQCGSFHLSVVDVVKLLLIATYANKRTQNLALEFRVTRH